MLEAVELSRKCLCHLQHVSLAPSANLPPARRGDKSHFRFAAGRQRDFPLPAMTPWSFVTKSGFVAGQITVAKPGRWFVLRTEIPSGCNNPETDSASSTLVFIVDGLAIWTRTSTARCSLSIRVSVSTASRRSRSCGVGRDMDTSDFHSGYSLPAMVNVTSGSRQSTFHLPIPNDQSSGLQKTKSDPG